MHRPRALTPLLLAGVLALTACSGGGPDAGDGAGDGAGPGPVEGSERGSAVSEFDPRTVRTPVGSVAVPSAWDRAPAGPSDGAEATYVEQRDGTPVAQVDVIINSVTPGTGADAVAAAIQGARLPVIPTLRHDERSTVSVPGAQSAFLTESHYRTTDTDQPARSLDQVAIAESGDYLLVRVSATAAGYDPRLARDIAGSMVLEDRPGNAADSRRGDGSQAGTS